MPEGIILRFEGVEDPDKFYWAINEELGIDAATGAGEWPEGLLSHEAGTTEHGFLVTEIWTSKSAQEAFMTGRLGRAFEKVKGPSPTSVEWFNVIGSWRR